MRIDRRNFLGTALATGAAAFTAPRLLRAQTPAPPAAAPIHDAKVEKLFKSPDRYPNALEATPDGLWVGDQVSERVLKMDWQTGKVLEDFVAEAHNTSGLAVGGGYLWIGCNGAGTASNRMRMRTALVAPASAATHGSACSSTAPPPAPSSNSTESTTS